MALIKIGVNLISVISGIVTILALFFAPVLLKEKFLQAFPLVITQVSNNFNYLWSIIVIPVLFGIISSRQQNGFTRFSPLHLIASVVIYPFWSGFVKGTKYIGYISLVIVFTIIMKSYI